MATAGAGYASQSWPAQLEQSEDQWVESLGMWELLGGYRQGVQPAARQEAVYAAGIEGSAPGGAARLAASRFVDEHGRSPLPELRRLQGLFVQRIMNALRREILEMHGAACKAESERKLALRTELKGQAAVKAAAKAARAAASASAADAEMQQRERRSPGERP